LSNGSWLCDILPNDKVSNVIAPIGIFTNDILPNDISLNEIFANDILPNDILPKWGI
jgi:hypothetical protein